MDEKLKILEMIESGKVTAKEGMELLSAMDNDKKTDTVKNEVSAKLSDGKLGKRYLKIKVDSDSDDFKRVDVNIPLRVARLASKFVNLVPKAAREEMAKEGIDIENLNLDEIIDALEEDLDSMKLVDVKGDKFNVDIYIE